MVDFECAHWKNKPWEMSSNDRRENGKNISQKFAEDKYPLKCGKISSRFYDKVIF